MHLAYSLSPPPHPPHCTSTAGWLARGHGVRLVPGAPHPPRPGRGFLGHLLFGRGDTGAACGTDGGAGKATPRGCRGAGSAAGGARAERGGPGAGTLPCVRIHPSISGAARRRPASQRPGNLGPTECRRGVSVCQGQRAAGPKEPAWRPRWGKGGLGREGRENPHGRNGLVFHANSRGPADHPGQLSGGRCGRRGRRRRREAGVGGRAGVGGAGESL